MQQLDLWWISQTGILLRSNGSSQYLHTRATCACFRPLNDDSLGMQYLCSAMPWGGPPSHSLTHIRTFPRLRVFLSLRPPVGGSPLADARGKRSVGHLNLLPPQEAAVKRSAANLIALQQSQPTVLWSCSSAERPSRFNARSRGF